jgi:hypothetical protein
MTEGPLEFASGIKILRHTRTALVGCPEGRERGILPRRSRLLGWR